MDNKSVVLKFNDCINGRDIDGLSSLMTDNHRFIDSANHTMDGKENCIRAWKDFFQMFPDYQNIFENIMQREDTIIVLGHSVCADKRLNGRAIWTARVENDKLAEWRVMEDSAENCKGLGV